MAILSLFDQRQRQFTALLALATALFLPACTRAPDLPHLGKSATVLAFGDSLTYGTGTTRESSYPAILQGLIGRKVINAGVPGETTDQGRRRLPRLLAEYQPDMLILCHGGNDLLRKLDHEKLAENLRAMIQAARKRGIPVVLIAVPRPAVVLMKTDDLYTKLAKEFSLPVETTALPDIESDNSLKSDAVHPNKAGYRQLAEAVEDLLRDRGAI